MSKSRSRLAADWFARLRVNALTQEVEHEDVIAEQEAIAAAKAKAISDAAVVEAARIAAANATEATRVAAANAAAAKVTSDLAAAKAAVDSTFVKKTQYATSTVGGSIKARLSGTNLYLTNNGTNA